MKKIKENILIRNILILLISGSIAKIIGMVGKIIYTRTAGINVVSLYTLLTPTLLLLIGLSQFSFPISISKLSAENKYDNKALLYSAYKIGFIINFIVILVIILSSDFIASLLHYPFLAPAIKCTIFVLPFITVSSILKGFLYGKEDMIPASITNIIEEIIKILLIIFILPIAIHKSDLTAIIFIILFNIITESSSIFIMSKVVNKKYIKNNTSKNSKIAKDILKISLPTTMIRLISTISFFFEPIILTNILLKDGLTINYITLEYGIINSYIIPLLSIPNFFSISIASALLPNITKAYYNKNYLLFNSKLIKLMILSLIVGIICLSFILFFPSQILNIIYNINYGVNYIYLIGPFFLILYMQPTLSVAIQAIGKTNKLFFISIISLVIKYGLLCILGVVGLKMYSLVYALIAGIIITTSLEIIIILKELRNRS